MELLSAKSNLQQRQRRVVLLEGSYRLGNLSLGVGPVLLGQRGLCRLKKIRVFASRENDGSRGTSIFILSLSLDMLTH